MNNNNVKYDRHQHEWDLVLSDKEHMRYGESWLKGGTLDSWRHTRMREFAAPIVRNDTKATWVTVGDGRFGTDANYLLSLGAEDVHCTDISDTLLKIGSEKGFIKSFSAENAEFLSFNDNAFDYVFCKEALHHFPRPFIALSEMFRVARKGVFLVEPRDRLIDRGPLAFALDLLRRIKGSNMSGHEFEGVGNYVYTVSERELEKFLLGIHYTKIAFNGLNDSYFSGAEFVELRTTSLRDRIKILRINATIAIQNLLEKLGLRKSGLLVALLFKEAPSSNLEEELRAAGWIVRSLPLNPHL